MQLADQPSVEHLHKRGGDRGSAGVTRRTEPANMRGCAVALSVRCAASLDARLDKLPNMSDHHQVVFTQPMLRKFIQMYKELRCLWDRNDAGYRNKNKKHEALTQLTGLVQEFEPNATRVHVLRKIESMRACVRREHKKVQDSRQSATRASEIHSPSLWYYHMLAFVFEDSPEKTTGIEVSKSSSEAEEEPEDDDGETDHQLDNDNQDSFEPDAYQTDYNIMNVEDIDRPSTSVKQARSNEEGYKIKRAKISSTEVDDEYDAIGVNVAAKLRNLPANMRIVAEKLINDVLFQAQINGLNSSTKIVTSDPFKNETSSTTP